VLTAVLIQAVVTLLAATVAWIGWGFSAGLSLLAGGGAIVLPNALLALRLLLGRPEHAPATLLVGEFVKIGLSVLLLWAAYRWIEALSWGALILGLVLALKALLLAPWAITHLDKWRAARLAP
jgi:ATP synthase protein I